MPTLTTNFSFQKPLVNNATDQDLWGGQLNTNWDDIDGFLFERTPPGIMIDYGGTTAPTGWLLCFGQSVSTTTFADLFAVIAFTFGGSGGSFDIPDLRGRAIAGKDDMGGVSADRLTGLTGGVDGDVLGGSGGDETHTLVAGEVPSLSGTVDGATAIGAGAGDSLGATGTGAGTIGVTVNSGGGGAHNNVQPTFILNKIIKT